MGLNVNRFVLVNGHGSMFDLNLFYRPFWLIKLPIEELKQFRQASL